MGNSPVNMARRRFDMDDALFAGMMGTIATAAAFTVWVGFVRDFGTMGSLSSILGLFVASFVFWAAGRLSKRVRRTRLSLLRRDDLRNRNHLIVTINLCKSLALGAEGADPTSPTALSAMRDTALHIGEASTTYEYLLTEQGKKLAESVQDAARTAIVGKSCTPADLSHIVDALAQLEGEILDVDNDALTRRRKQEVGDEDSPPE